MCEDTLDTGRNLTFTSVTELQSGAKHCSVNDGRSHFHCIKTENRRREIATVVGSVRTHSLRKQIDFLRNSAALPTWDVDLQALGYSKSCDKAEIQVHGPHSSTEDIVAELMFEFDDAFPREDDAHTLTIRVNL